MPHQDKSQKIYLDLGINLEWPQAFQLIFSQEHYGQDLGIPTPTRESHVFSKASTIIIECLGLHYSNAECMSVRQGLN